MIPFSKLRLIFYSRWSNIPFTILHSIVSMRAEMNSVSDYMKSILYKKFISRHGSLIISVSSGTVLHN